MSVAEIPLGVTLEIETQYYTDWKCSVCKEWQRRSTPARVITTRAGSSVQCLKHDDDPEDDDECWCHCHQWGPCEECGDFA